MASQFANVAVLKASRVKVVDEQGASLPTVRICSPPYAVHSAGNLDVGKRTGATGCSMRAHGHGGTLLVVPAEARLAPVDRTSIFYSSRRIFQARNLIKKVPVQRLRTNGSLSAPAQSKPLRLTP